MASQSTGEKTKLLIANSLRKLMKKKSLDKIKIREIVEDCGVNRQTFYYHFQDIYALVEWIYTYDGMQIFNEYKDDCDWMSVIKMMFNYLFSFSIILTENHSTVSPKGTSQAVFNISLF